MLNLSCCPLRGDPCPFLLFFLLQISPLLVAFFFPMLVSWPNVKSFFYPSQNKNNWGLTKYIFSPPRPSCISQFIPCCNISMIIFEQAVNQLPVDNCFFFYFKDKLISLPDVTWLLIMPFCLYAALIQYKRLKQLEKNVS